MKLTKLERDILNHRLEVHDAIAEVLIDEDGIEPGSAQAETMWNEVYDLCGLLHKGQFEEARLLNEDLALRILQDCVDGGTYYGASKQVDSRRELRAIEVACVSLAQKVEEYTGLVAEYPLC